MTSSEIWYCEGWLTEAARQRLRRAWHCSGWFFRGKSRSTSTAQSTTSEPLWDSAAYCSTTLLGSETLLSPDVTDEGQS